MPGTLLTGLLDHLRHLAVALGLWRHCFEKRSSFCRYSGFISSAPTAAGSSFRVVSAMRVSTKPALEDWPLTAILDLFVRRAATALNDGFARDLVCQLAGALIHKMLLWGDRSPSTDPKAYVEAVLEGIGFPCRSGQQK